VAEDDDRRQKKLYGPAAVTGFLTLWAAGLGMLSGIGTSLSVTVPELVNSPSSAGGTGSMGLVIFGALVGAIVGLALGLIAAVGGAISGSLHYSLTGKLNWWTAIFDAGGAGLASGLIWFLVTLVSSPLSPSSPLNSPWLIGITVGTVAFGLGVAVIKPNERTKRMRSIQNHAVTS